MRFIPVPPRGGRFAGKSPVVLFDAVARSGSKARKARGEPRRGCRIVIAKVGADNTARS